MATIVHTLPEWYPAAAVTLGRHVFVKDSIKAGARYVVLRHELVHVEDQERWGLLWWLSYLLMPIPGPFTLRGWWEWRAYKATLWAWYDLQGHVTERQADLVVGWMSGPLYWWAMPRSLARWLVRRYVATLGG